MKVCQSSLLLEECCQCSESFLSLIKPHFLSFLKKFVTFKQLQLISPPLNETLHSKPFIVFSECGAESGIKNLGRSTINERIVLQLTCFIVLFLLVSCTNQTIIRNKMSTHTLRKTLFIFYDIIFKTLGLQRVLSLKISMS